MGSLTAIEWTDATWNPIGGCSVASPGCKPCYAMQLAGTRLLHHPLYAGTTNKESGRPVFNGKMTAAADDHDVWSWPVRWRGARAPKLGAGRQSLIFVGDMADLFHANRPRAMIDRTATGILYARHIGQLLTKRPDIMAEYFYELLRADRWRDFSHPLLGKPNFADEATFDNSVRRRFWLGTSAERQKEFDERWPHLRCMADLGFTVFISYEPAMGPLVLPADFLALGKRAQVIAGGVSGRWPWAPHPDWFRSVRDQCGAAGVAFFFKQWGEWAPHNGPLIEEASDSCMVAWPDGTIGGGHARDHDGSGIMLSDVGKKAAGALLDGREHREFPT